MIYTVTLNPAFDQTITCAEFSSGDLNHALDSRKDIGGKGINVSKIIYTLGGKSIACGLLPEIGSEEFLDGLTDLDIDSVFVITDQQTIRTNIKIVSQKTEELTEINQSGTEISLLDLELLTENLLEMIQIDDIVVLSGSMPKNFPDETYSHMIMKLNQVGGKVLLDVDGKLLEKSLNAKPFFIKPNLFELEQLAGKSLNNIDEIEAAVEPILAQGIDHILVSLGAKGSYYSSHSIKYMIEPLEVEVKSPVGAGDAMVAAFAYGLNNKWSIEKTLKFAAATSTAMVNTEGTSIPSNEKIMNLLEKVILRKLEEI